MTASRAGWRVVAVLVATTLALVGAAVTGCARSPARQRPAPGAFLGSGAAGVALVPGFERWLGAQLTVGRTYLAGTSWTDIEQPGDVIGPWSRWKNAVPGRMLVVNVPMLEPNEPPMDDAAVRAALRDGAAGAFDRSFRLLGEQLVRAGAADAVLDLGWEMNGVTYSSRCAPDPAGWIAYQRRLVSVLRTVAGQRFRFEFTPSRGSDAVAWPDCYPGDGSVDIVGMDSYDQPPGTSFADYARQPYGMDAAANFARAHGKALAIPEWGLASYGDNPGYVRDMGRWVHANNALYQSITDYCPHGVWRCDRNPRSAAAYRYAFGHR